MSDSSLMLGAAWAWKAEHPGLKRHHFFPSISLAFCVTLQFVGICSKCEADTSILTPNMGSHQSCLAPWEAGDESIPGRHPRSALALGLARLVRGGSCKDRKEQRLRNGLWIVLSEEGNPAGLSSCSGGLRPLVELCVEPAGLCG